MNQLTGKKIIADSGLFTLCLKFVAILIFIIIGECSPGATFTYHDVETKISEFICIDTLILIKIN